MNASFRTAFWAMCLGLMVPMVLFIGAEVISPGSTSRKAAAAAADRIQNLQTRLHVAAAKPPASGWRTVQNSQAGKPSAPKPMPGDARSKMTTNSGKESSLSDANGAAQTESDSVEPQVVLGPELEPEQTVSDEEPGLDHRVPAVPAHTRPKVRILPDVEPLPAGGAWMSAAIEQRLAGIQIDLDKIGRALDSQAQRDQAPREPPVDPVKQVTELLKQLQEVRLRDHPPPLIEEPVCIQPPDENRDSTEPRKKLTSLPPESTHDAPPNEAEPRNAEPQPQLVTRIYRPRYLSGSALQALVEPLLTRDVGRTGATDAETVDQAPANGSSATTSGANALVVRDLPIVMQKIDHLITKLDVPPTQVELEAVVMTLPLNANSPQGVDLSEFNSTGQPFVVSALDAGLRPLATGGLTLTSGFGLKCGVLTGDLRAFVSALEAAAQVRGDGSHTTRAWQISVVNRHSAVLMLNDPFGPAGSGNQFAAGAILKIRPIVDRTGLIQLDVERDVELDAQASGSRAAALTNRITLHDGQTAVVGGFFAEQTALHSYRPAGIGQLPLVGGFFRKESEVLERRETIVLLTPHLIIAPVAEADSQLVRKSRPPAQNADTSTTMHASHAVKASPGKAPPPPRIRPSRSLKKAEPGV